STDMQGGTLNAAWGGGLGTVSGNTVTLDGNAQGTLNNKGTFTIPDNSTTILVGTINNTGTIQINAVGDATFLRMNGGVTLTGAGTVTMATTGTGQAIISADCNCSAALTNVNNVIQGVGQIGNNGLPLTNQAGGTINANISGTN